MNHLKLFFGVIAVATVAEVTIVAAAPYTCTQLGYDTVKSKCRGGYWTCPLDSSAVKCDEVAEVGDIKYSSSTSPAAGWLYCDGRELKQSDYQDLYNLIGDFVPGGSSGMFNIPDYRGVYLRATGKTTSANGSSVGTTSLKSFQASTFLSHSHSFEETAFPYSTRNSGYEINGKAKDFKATVLEKITIGDAGESETCVNSYGLLPYIYAGKAVSDESGDDEDSTTWPTDGESGDSDWVWDTGNGATWPGTDNNNGGGGGGVSCGTVYQYTLSQAKMACVTSGNGGQAEYEQDPVNKGCYRCSSASPYPSGADKFVTTKENTFLGIGGF